MLMSISVLGLSGPESERGPEGVGKSCLCNRIVRPPADDYQEQHLWLLSSSDFNSRVVNSDQFLYWGPATINSGGVSCNVNIIEQTEFIHDETLRPFPASQPYLKRATSLKLRSHDKLAYFSKFQLGFENEYPSISMPPELSVDGFVLCYDVSTAHYQQKDNQDRLICRFAQDIHKMGKPFCVALTKLDIADSEMLAHFYEMASGNRYLKNISVIETSAKLNINIDHVVGAVSVMILKPSSNKQRSVKFSETYAKQSLNDQHLSERFQNFLLQNVVNWHTTWASCEATFLRNPIYQNFVERFGGRTARSFFELHINKLCSQFASMLVRQWLSELPSVFSGLFADVSEFSMYLESDLDVLYKMYVQKLRAHPRFEAYFQPQALFTAFMAFPNATGQSLLEAVRTDKRIPVDILESLQAFEVFKTTYRNLKRKNESDRLRNELKSTLDNDSDYAPGMKPEESLQYVRTKYGDRFEGLEETDQRRVFDEVQLILADRAIRDLRNLIEQNCADVVFDSNTYLDVALDKAERLLSGRTRYQRCDRLPQLRTQVLRDWLSTAKAGDCRSCPSGQPNNCMANRVRQSLGVRPIAAPRRFGISLIGTKSDASWFESAAKYYWPDNMIKADAPRSNSPSFRVDFVRLGETLSGEQSTSAVNSRSVQRADALIFLVSSQATLQSTSESLQNVSISSITAPRIICVISPRDDSPVRDDVYRKVKTVAEKASVELIDCRATSTAISVSLNRLAVSAAQQFSAACASRTPDVRITFFCRCNDSYSSDLITGPLLRGSCFHLDSDDQLPSCVSIVRQHLFLDSFRKTVQILLVPYHARSNPTVFHAAEKSHGVVLVFDPTSPQSFATMASEANRRAGMPLFLLAVDEGTAVDSLYTTEPSRSILNDAASLAEKLEAHFAKTSSNFASQSAVYTPFIRAAFDKREKTEQLWVLSQQNKRIVTSATQNITVNSLGRSQKLASNGKESSPLNHLGLVLPLSNTTPSKDKSSKRTAQDKAAVNYQASGEQWPILHHPIDPETGASSPVVLLLRAIEKHGGCSTLGIYRVPGSATNSQSLFSQLRTGTPLTENDLVANYDVQTLATTLKSVISRSLIFNDELAGALVEHFSKDSTANAVSEAGLVAALSSLLSSRLPVSPHRRTLRRLFSHLAEIAERQPETMNAQNLARVFWPSLLQPLTNNIDALEQVTRLQNMAELTLVFIIGHWPTVIPEN